MSIPLGSAGLKDKSILDRQAYAAPHSSAFTSTQSQVDSLVENFVEQASDWKSLAAMMAGGLAYRWGRIGVMSTNWARQAAPLQRPMSVLFGLSSEVTAFEFTNRSLQTLNPSPVTGHLSPNIWSFSGPGGIKQGWLSSFVTFGTLKSFGRLAQEQNLILQHGVQDLSLVAGHQLVYRAGIGEKPEGGFADQMVHAEATNLQLGAGMSLGHILTNGKLLATERALDLRLKNGEMILGRNLREGQTQGLPLQMAMAGLEGEGGSRERANEGDRGTPFGNPKDNPTVTLMSGNEEIGGGNRRAEPEAVNPFEAKKEENQSWVSKTRQVPQDSGEIPKKVQKQIQRIIEASNQDAFEHASIAIQVGDRLITVEDDITSQNTHSVGGPSAKEAVVKILQKVILATALPSTNSLRKETVRVFLFHTHPKQDRSVGSFAESPIYLHSDGEAFTHINAQDCRYADQNLKVIEEILRGKGFTGSFEVIAGAVPARTGVTSENPYLSLYTRKIEPLLTPHPSTELRAGSSPFDKTQGRPLTLDAIKAQEDEAVKKGYIINRGLPQYREMALSTLMGDLVHNIRSRFEKGKQVVRILDLGSGKGHAARDLKFKFGERVRMETNDRHPLAPEFTDEHHQADFLEMSPDREYDLILSIYGPLAHHEGRFFSMLQKAVDHLAPGGELVAALTLASLDGPEYGALKNFTFFPKIMRGFEKDLVIRYEKVAEGNLLYIKRLGNEKPPPLSEILKIPTRFTSYQEREATRKAIQKQLTGKFLEAEGVHVSIVGALAHSMAENIAKLDLPEFTENPLELANALFGNYIKDFKNKHRCLPSHSELDNWVHGYEPNSFLREPLLVDEVLKLKMEGWRPSGWNLEFFETSLKTLEKGQSALSPDRQEEYRTLLHQVMTGEVSPPSGYQKLFEILEKDYLEKLEVQGGKPDEKSLRDFIEELSQQPKPFPSWAQELMKEPELSKMKVQELIFPLKAEKYPAEFFLAVSVFRLFQKEMGLSFESLYVKGTEDHGFRFLPPKILLTLMERVYGPTAIHPRFSAEKRHVEEIRRALEQESRDVLLSPYSQEIHGVKDVHPYLVLLHDLYHLAKLGRLPLTERKDRFALFDALMELQDHSEAYDWIESYQDTILDGDYAGPKDHRILFRTLANQFPPKNFAQAFSQSISDRFAHHPNREEILKAFREEFSLSPSPPPSAPVALNSMFGLGLTELLRVHQETVPLLPDLSSAEKWGLIGVGVLLGVGAGIWAFRKLSSSKKWNEKPPYTQLKLPLSEEERKLLQPFVGEGVVPHVLTGKDWAQIEDRVFNNNVYQIGRTIRVKNSKLWDLWVKIDDLLHKRNLKPKVSGVKKSAEPDDLAFSGWSLENISKVTYLRDIQEERELGVPEMYEHSLNIFKKEQLGDIFRGLMKSESADSREMAIRLYIYYVRQLQSPSPSGFPMDWNVEFLTGAKALQNLRNDPVPSVRSLAETASLKVKDYLSIEYQRLLD